MLPFERKTSDPIFRGAFSIVQRAGQWILRGPGGEERTVGPCETTARQAMETAHVAFLYRANCRVYFIGEAAALGAAVKIGFTKRPSKRLREIQRANLAQLKILALTIGDQDDEWRYHQRFSGQRLHCEWFTIDAEILAEIEHLNDRSAIPHRRVEHVGTAGVLCCTTWTHAQQAR